MAPAPSKVALVTGGARRIGKAICESLSTAGWSVAIHFRSSQEQAEALAGELNRDGAASVAVQADLRDDDALSALIAEAADKLGPVTALINNASIFEDDSVQNLSRETWQAHMDVHVFAPLMLAKHFAARLPADCEGNIINMIDERVWRLTPRFLTYTVSKSALWTLTQTLAQSLAPQIRVNAIGPGPVLPSKRQNDADFERQVEALPLRRKTDPEEIARTVDFILAARSLTGQMITLDGGQHLAWQTPDVTNVKE